MDANEIVKALREWDELYLADVCADIPMGCDKYCKDKDCIVVQAVRLIESMQAENARLKAELAAVVGDIPHICTRCAHFDTEQCNLECFIDGKLHWQWRGKRKENWHEI